MANFETALPVILAHEGGLVDNPADPGGITNKGISLRFLKSERVDINGDGVIDADDVRDITDEQVAEIYRHFFWDAVQGDNIDDQIVATKIFDMAVNMGSRSAIKIAQEASGATVDGVLGPKTLSTINTGDPTELVDAICAAQANFYKAIVAKRPASSVFLKGWLKRAAWPHKKV